MATDLTRRTLAKRLGADFARDQAEIEHDAATVSGEDSYNRGSRDRGAQSGHKVQAISAKELKAVQGPVLYDGRWVRRSRRHAVRRRFEQSAVGQSVNDRGTTWERQQLRGWVVLNSIY